LPIKRYDKDREYSDKNIQISRKVRCSEKQVLRKFLCHGIHIDTHHISTKIMGRGALNLGGSIDTKLE